MKKTIDTLVEDINNLFSFDPIAMDEKDVDKCIDTFGDMLKLHVKDFLYEKPSTNGHLRLSSIGKPDSYCIILIVKRKRALLLSLALELNSYTDIFLKSFFSSVLR